MTNYLTIDEVKSLVDKVSLWRYSSKPIDMNTSCPVKVQLLVGLFGDRDDDLQLRVGYRHSDSRDLRKIHGAEVVGGQDILLSDPALRLEEYASIVDPFYFNMLWGYRGGDGHNQTAAQEIFELALVSYRNSTLDSVRRML